MRLTELNPRWIDQGDRHGIGITFDCPGACCAGAPSFFEWDPGMPRWKRRAGVFFDKPLGGGAPLDRPDGTWARTGDTLETLTLSPSVWISPPDHWHGHVANGEIVEIK